MFHHSADCSRKKRLYKNKWKLLMEQWMPKPTKRAYQQDIYTRNDDNGATKQSF